MPRDGTKLALFIDGANLYAAAKALGFVIDYKRLLTEFRSRGTLVRAFYYTVVIEIVLFSGDNAFCALVQAVRRQGVRVSVVSTTADELRRQADVFIDLMEL